MGPFNVKNIRFAYPVAVAVDLLGNTATREQYQLLSVLAGWKSDRIAIKEPGNLSPAMVAFTSGSLTVVCFRGTSNPLQAFQYCALAGLAHANPQDLQVNKAWDLWAEVALDWLEDHDYFSAAQIVFAGHSYGGAVAEAAALRLAAVVGIGRVQWITFAAPRLGNARTMGILQGIPNVRYMNPADPVPFLPPDSQDLPIGLLGQYLASSRLLFDYDQTPLGTLLLDGVMDRYATYPTGVPPVHVLGLPAWLKDFTGKCMANHPMHTYAEKLRVRWAAAVQKQIQLDALSYFSGIGKLTLRKGNGNVVLPLPAPPAALAAAANVSVTGVPPIMEGKRMAFIPAQYRFKKARLPGGNWCSVWLGLTVFEHPSLSRVLVFNKSMNKVLRALQTAAFFDDDKWALSFSDYITAARAGGLGFAPDQLGVSP